MSDLLKWEHIPAPIGPHFLQASDASYKLSLCLRLDYHRMLYLDKSINL